MYIVVFSYEQYNFIIAEMKTDGGDVVEIGVEDETLKDADPASDDEISQSEDGVVLMGKSLNLTLSEGEVKSSDLSKNGQ